MMGYLTNEVGIDGMLIAPGYQYSQIDPALTMTRAEHEEKFRVIRAARPSEHGYRWLASPIYQDFLTGERKLPCAPWGSITRNPYGWKGPCYLLTDGIFPTYEALLEGIEWEALRPRQRPALRALRDPLRLRAVRRVRGDGEREGDRPEHGVDADGMTFACATTAEERIARARPGSAAVVGVGARTALPEGRLVSFGLAGALRDGLACGEVLDATRVVDARRRDALGGRAARRLRRADGDDPRRRRGRRRPGRAARALHERTGADAVDMESGALARSGRLAGCLRAISRHARARTLGRSPACSTPTARWRGRARRARSRAPRATRARRRAPAFGARCAGRGRRSREREGAARRAAIVLRRRRPGDRDRRAAARGARPAGLRPARDRPQRQRRPAARAARRGLRRVARTRSRPARSACSRRTASRRPCARTAWSAGLRVVDAVCPLVSKVHAEARRYADSGHLVALVGHADHVEVIGTKGERPEPDRRRRVARGRARARRRTASRSRSITPDDALARRRRRRPSTRSSGRFGGLRRPGADDICYATQNRQDAVKEIVAARARRSILVIGSPTSSNANRLVEVARLRGAEATLDRRRERARPTSSSKATRSSA